MKQFGVSSGSLIQIWIWRRTIWVPSQNPLGSCSGQQEHQRSSKINLKTKIGGNKLNFYFTVFPWFETFIFKPVAKIHRKIYAVTHLNIIFQLLKCDNMLLSFDISNSRRRVFGFLWGVCTHSERSFDSDSCFPELWGQRGGRCDVYTSRGPYGALKLNLSLITVV